MSYGLCIRSDQHYSEKVERERVKAYLSGLPEMKPNGNNGFMFGSPESGKCAFFDLELVDVEGNNLAALHEFNPNQYPAPTEEEAAYINCININIPAAFSEATDDALYNHYLLISEHLHWHVYDKQTGEILGD